MSALNPEHFAGFIVTAAGKPAQLRQDLTRADIAGEGTCVAVTHTSLNYKDALAVTGKGPVLRRFPLVPGIDLAGVVQQCDGPSSTWTVGQSVFATGHGLGEEYSGGFAQFACVDPGSLTAMPAGRDAVWAMALGTAGVTAMAAVHALEDHGVRPQTRPVVVTGAGGGVGSLAVLILASRGHRVTAVTGRAELAAWLRSLGASDVLDRANLQNDAARPLAAQRWSGGIDTVGGRMLTGMLSATATGGCVAACGLAGGSELTTTVMPFILRGITMVGIDSVRLSGERRERVWRDLADTISNDRLGYIARVEPLSAVLALAEELLSGRIRGRIVLDVRH